MKSSTYKCKVCGEEFSSEKGLHLHLKKHKMDLATYYTNYFPRKNLLTGEPLPFKNKSDYFSKDFSTRRQLLKWCKQADEVDARNYALKKLKERIKDKKLKRGPNHLELKIAGLPDLEIYKKLFGSYSKACKQAGVKPLFFKKLNKSLFKQSYKDLKIFVDTREQQPLNFKNSSELKLDFGDYTAAGEDYSYTYVDRKAEQDFKGTMSGGFERFKRELERAREFKSFLFVVVESDLNKIYKNNKFGPHRSNLNFIYHNMRVLTHEFNDCCQFVFTGSRENSEKIIPKILKMGKSIWGVDLQYYIDTDGLD
tara:strand:+ start:6601 stop:7530 length:930 start_codon:yes stop_codon:yes gene_type:complete